MIESSIQGLHLLLYWFSCSFLVTVSNSQQFQQPIPPASSKCESFYGNIEPMPPELPHNQGYESYPQNDYDEDSINQEDSENAGIHLTQSITRNKPRLEVSCAITQHFSTNPIDNCGPCSQLLLKDSVISVISTNVYQLATMLEDLYLAETRIQKIEPGGFAHLPSLKSLHLEGNNLTSIRPGVFNSLVNLHFLNLSHNVISKVDEESFHGSQEIEILDLSFNNISSIPIVFKNNKLTSLNVSNNRLTSIDDLICQSDFALTTLILNNNLLNKVPACLNESSVTHLSLSFNSITSFISTELPPELQEFFISNNKLHHLNEDSFRFLLHLKSLDISNNFLEKYPYDCFKHIQTLQFLDISSTNIKTIHPQFFNITKTLQGLSLSKTGISFLQEGVFQSLSTLTHLDLSRNNITLLQHGVLTDLGSLEILNISHNKIEYLQAGVFNGLKMLQVLDLSSNNINFFGCHLLRPLKKLRVLNISFNQLVSLEVDFNFPYTTPFTISIDINGNNFSCNYLAKIILNLERRGILVVAGKTISSENIDGISCKEKDNEKNNEDVMENITYFFGSGFKNTSFYEFFKNFRTPKPDEGGRNLNKVLEYLRANLTMNFSDNLNNHVKDFMKLEKASFQDFLRRLENTRTNNQSKSLDNLSSTLQNEIQSFVNLENTSLTTFMEKLSKIVDRVEESRNEYRRIPEMMNSLQEIKAESLISSKETKGMSELIAAINQLKFFMIVCTFVVVLLVVGFKVFPYAKKGYLNGRFHEQNHEMPMLS